MSSLDDVRPLDRIAGKYVHSLGCWVTWVTSNCGLGKRLHGSDSGQVHRQAASRKDMLSTQYSVLSYRFVEGMIGADQLTPSSPKMECVYPLLGIVTLSGVIDAGAVPGTLIRCNLYSA